ncbi:MAG TPA: aldo/keto reductase, partial [Rhizomicrobium sp.]|nr:aldo/keto reductase [Rhizomicrobium sp.]
LLHKPIVTSVLIGATTLKQLTDNLGASEIDLTPDELQRLDDASALPQEYPGWMQLLKGARRQSFLDRQRC